MSISKQIMTVAIMMTVGLVSLSARPAFAVKQFYDEFKEVYAGDGGLDPSLVAKAKCNICHVKGEKKKVKNDYGKLLDELLDRKTDAKNPEKIREALAKVADMKSPSGETWGEMIKAGKLPE
jgi:hypothetical protein